MYRIRSTDVFDRWLNGLRDRRVRAKIADRLIRFEAGNLGDIKPVGNGISEARIPYGPGYRLYFIIDGGVVIVLLCGGDKSTQSQDIEKARRLASEWRN